MSEHVTTTILKRNPHDGFQSSTVVDSIAIPGSSGFREGDVVNVAITRVPKCVTCGQHIRGTCEPPPFITAEEIVRDAIRRNPFLDRLLGRRADGSYERVREISTRNVDTIAIRAGRINWRLQLCVAKEEAIHKALIENVVGAVSDGVSWGEAKYAMYGVDRSEASNADWRSHCIVNAGDFTLFKLISLRNAVRLDGGQPDLALMSLGTMQRAVSLVSTDPADYLRDKVVAHIYEVGDVEFVSDTEINNGVLYLLDPQSWMLYYSTNVDQGCIALYLLCLQPRRNGKLTGIYS